MNITKFTFLRFICICLIPPVFLLSGCGSEEKSETVSAKKAESTYVYITRTGECYHKSNCYTLKKSKIKRTLIAVCDNYRPCQICHPPIIE